MLLSSSGLQESWYGEAQLVVRNHFYIKPRHGAVAYTARHAKGDLQKEGKVQRAIQEGTVSLI